MNLINEYREVLALLIMGAGYFAARWLSVTLVNLIVLIEEKMSGSLGMTSGHHLSERGQQLIREWSFYLLLLLFFVSAIRVLGVTEISEILDSLLAYVPMLLIGLVVIVIGYLLSLAMRNIVGSLPGIDETSSLPILAQVMVMIVAIVTGMSQMGVDISFLGNLIVVLVAAFLLGISLSFALGAKQLVANMLATRELNRYQVGDRLCIGELEGTIQEIHQTGVLLEVAEGIVNVPATVFAEEKVIHLSAGDSA